METNKLQCEGMPGNMNEQFDLRIFTLTEQIKNCSEEIIKSNELKGLIEFSLIKYTDGFQKGQNQYFNEKYFASSTGLFN
ncbi:MAG: hypothetical protein LH629_02805 [Ignavibacteria bacterium]|nr:hypothetical protein [Ignavibacteria bacterium]